MSDKRVCEHCGNQIAIKDPYGAYGYHCPNCGTFGSGDSPAAKEEKPCDDCQTCHCPTTWAKKRIAELTKERDEARELCRRAWGAKAYSEDGKAVSAAIERWDTEKAAVQREELLRSLHDQLGKHSPLRPR